MRGQTRNTHVRSRAANQQTHIDAPPRGVHEQGDEILVGCEIRVGDEQRASSAGNRECQIPFGGGAAETRRGVEERSVGHAAVAMGHRSASGEKLSRGFRVRGDAGFRELQYSGTFDADARVTPTGTRLALTQPLVVETEATGPADLEVDQDRSDVGAVLDYPEVAEPKRPKRNDVRAGFAQTLGVCSSECLGAEGVVEKIDPDTRPSALDEDFGEGLGDLTGKRVVHLDGDRSPGAAKVVPESREDAAVEHDLHQVAGKQCRARQQRDRKRKRALVRGDRRPIDSNAAHPANSGAAGQEKQSDEGGKCNDSDECYVQHSPDVMHVRNLNQQHRLCLA